VIVRLPESALASSSSALGVERQEPLEQPVVDRQRDQCPADCFPAGDIAVLEQVRG
jgi:hypothetical protein